MRATKKFPVSSSLTTVDAPAADNLVDSIGVNTHMHYNDTTYYDGGRLLTLLTSLGVRHVRDGVVFNRSDVYATAQSIHSAGISFNLLIGNPAASDITLDIANYLAALKDSARYAGIFTTIESPNEYDISGQSNWQTLLYNYVSAAYGAIKGDSTLSAVPYLGPSFGGGGQNSYLSAYPDAGDYLDYGNLHIYSGGRYPEGSLPAAISGVTPLSGSKPLHLTETGLHTAQNDTNSANFAVSEATQAVYIVRSYLEAYRLGAKRTYCYELLDEKPEPAMQNQEEHFGLIAVSGDPNAAVSTWTLRNKPSYVALQRLISLLADPSQTSSTATLALNVQGIGASVRQLVFSRSDGSYDIVLWNALINQANATFTPHSGYVRQSSYTVVAASAKSGVGDAYNGVGYTYPVGSVGRNGDQDVEYAKYFQAVTGPELDPADVPVVVTLPGPVTAQAARPCRGASFSPLGRGQRIILPIGADPTILRLAV